MAEETMTPETTENVDVEALQAEISRLTSENTKLKESVSTASSQAADFKRKWRDTLSAQDKQNEEIAEQRAQEKELLNQLLTEKRISGYAEKLVAAGCDASTAKIMASVLPEGVGDEYFAAVKAGFDTKAESMKNALLNQQPSLTGGQVPTAEAAQKVETEKLRKYFGL